MAGYNTIGILVFRFRSRDAFFLCSRYPVIFGLGRSPLRSSILLSFTSSLARSSTTVSSSFSIQRHLSSVSYFSDSSLSSISFQHFFQRFKVFIGKEVLKCIFIYCTVKSRRILTFVWKKRDE